MVSRTLAKIAIIVHKQGNAWFNLRSVLQRLVKFILFLQSIPFLGGNVENVKKKNVTFIIPVLFFLLAWLVLLQLPNCILNKKQF